MSADQICVLDGGLIRERGNHEELIAQDGIYAKLVSRQLSRTRNIIEDEAVGAATAASASAKDAKAKEEALKLKKSKVDDFDSLFEEEEEKKQIAASSALAAAASSSAPPTNGSNGTIARTAPGASD